MLAIIALTLLLIAIYTFTSNGDHLKRFINTTFVIGIFSVILSSSIAIFQSGSLHLFLAGFSKKIKEDVVDNLKTADPKQESEKEKQKEQRIGHNLIVIFPLFWGMFLVILSFVLSYLFY